MKALHATAKVSDLIYDVGMHKGEDTAFYLKKGFKVIAFEADPDLIAHCKKRFKKEIDNETLKIVEGAITEAAGNTEKPESIKFYKNSDNSVWGTVDQSWANRNEHLGTTSEVIEVPKIDFINCLQEHGIPHYLKIDIEGMDTLCLEALLSFSNRPDYISIESDITSFKKLKKEINLFDQLGYSKFKSVNQADISRQNEPEMSLEGSYVGHTPPQGSSGLFGTDLPEKWKAKGQILLVYRFILLAHFLLGNYGIVPRRYFFARKLSSLFGFSIPGWHDTHARHRTVDMNSN